MKPDIIKLRRPVLISKIPTKLCQNTSHRVTYVLTTKMYTLGKRLVDIDKRTLFEYNFSVCSKALPNIYWREG